MTGNIGNGDKEPSSQSDVVGRQTDATRSHTNMVPTGTKGSRIGSPRLDDSATWNEVYPTSKNSAFKISTYAIGIST